MPLYEYSGPKDGTFERMQKYSDPPITTCPECGGPVERLLSAPAIQFKGTGWYVTDYARKSGGGEPARESSGKDKGGSKETKAGSSTASASSSEKTTGSGDKK